MNPRQQPERRPRAKFSLGEVVHVKDWKGAERLGKVMEVTYYDDEGYRYTVEWSQVERIFAEPQSLRSLTKLERGGQRRAVAQGRKG